MSQNPTVTDRSVRPANGSATAVQQPPPPTAVSPSLPAATTYQRYHIETHPAPDIVPWPSQFNVHVKRAGLAKLLLKELIQYKGSKEVVLSRPCVYGVFSGPVGGFMPREEKCVGCLRCTTQYPHFVQIRPNPDRQQLGDTYFTAAYVNTIAYEASSGTIPVRGAGYRGKFGGQGWDGLWTDMSEIVRPTRDGIHGREFISTVVDIGTKPAFLHFDEQGQPIGPTPHTCHLPLPILFDVPPMATLSTPFPHILAHTAQAVDSLAILPISLITTTRLQGAHLVPQVKVNEAWQLNLLTFTPRLIQLVEWDEALYQAVQTRFPHTLICLRLPFAAGDALRRYYDAGVRLFHLTADYHGRSADGTFILDLIRAAHKTFVASGCRDEVTLLGSGGIIAAEHIPKAIIMGLDAVVLDTPLLVALQASFAGDFKHPTDTCTLPAALSLEWGQQRLKNLTATWRDQLLEILGAMGLREVRRLRGETGRAMFHQDLEREAFGDIEGYDD